MDNSRTKLSDQTVAVDTKSYEMKTVKGDFWTDENLNNVEIKQTDNVTKLNNFKERLKQFEDVETLEDAIELAKKILPVKNEITRFNVGDAKCTIVNRENNFRISLDTETEFLCYDFE